MRQFLFALASFCILFTFGARAKPLDRVEAVVLTSPAGGVRLNGIMRIPTGPGPFPAVVLLPERGSDARDPNSGDNQLLGSLADYLVSQGILVLRLHERGNGGSEGSNSTTTLADRSADALAALNYLRTRPQVDVTRLGLIGHGEGGNVALLAGAQPLAPTFVVALAAAGLPGKELLATQPVMYGKVLSHDSTPSASASTGSPWQRPSRKPLKCAPMAPMPPKCKLTSTSSTCAKRPLCAAIRNPSLSTSAPCSKLCAKPPIMPRPRPF